MDDILKGILSSNHPDNLKKQLIQKIAQKGAQPQPVKVIRSVLELAVKWILENVNEISRIGGLNVYHSWAKYNLSTFEEFFNREFLMSLLSLKNQHDEYAITLIHESMDLLQRSATFQSYLQIIETKTISYVREHPNLPCLSRFITFLKDYHSCIPKGDFTSTFCISLIHALSLCALPDKDMDVIQYIKNVENVCSFISSLWNNTNSGVVMDSLKTIFNIISSVDETEMEPSLCLGGLAQYIPFDMIDVVVKFAITNKGIKNPSMTAALQRIVDWLQWPTSKNIDQWIIAFLKSLASEKRFSVLIKVTETKIDKVFEKIQIPLVRDGAVNVTSNMLLSFQHSPEPFHKILPQVPRTLSVLKQDKSADSCLKQIVEVLHCCMYLHAGYPDLYDPIIDLLKDLPIPDQSVIQSKLEQNKWTAQKVDNFSYISKATQKSETGKTGLFNLGNTCYMNSILQAMYMCDDFRRAVMAHPVSLEQPIMLKLQYVFAFLTQTQRPAYAPVNFLHVARPTWFSAGHQQDCSEFLKYVLDQMHEQEYLYHKKQSDTAQKTANTNSDTPSSGDSVKGNNSVSETNAPKEVSSAEDFLSLVRQHFGGESKTTYTCLNCKKESSRIEHFSDIPLAFPENGLCDSMSLAGGESKASTRSSAKKETPVEKNTEGQQTINMSVDDSSGANTSSSSSTSTESLHLNDLLQFYLKQEMLTGDNKYHCENCEGLQEGERKIQVTTAPDHLIFTLLRFSYDIKKHTRSKIFQDIKYPRTLILPVDYASSEEKSASNKRQSLRSAVTGKINRCGVEVNTKRGEVYGLCGVVVHSGTSSECGHYYAYARHSLFCDPDTICNSLEHCQSEDEIDFLQDKWYLFNDNRVSYASYTSFCDVTQRFSKDTAYVLCYKRIDTKNAERQELDMNKSLHAVDVDPPLRTDLRAAVSKDNAMFLQEQENAARKKNNRKRPVSTSNPFNNWQNREDDDDDPPGSCGGGRGGGLGDLDTSGAKFVF